MITDEDRLLIQTALEAAHRQVQQMAEQKALAVAASGRNEGAVHATRLLAHAARARVLAQMVKDGRLLISEVSGTEGDTSGATGVPSPSTPSSDQEEGVGLDFADRLADPGPEYVPPRNH